MGDLPAIIITGISALCVLLSVFVISLNFERFTDNVLGLNSLNFTKKNETRVRCCIRVLTETTISYYIDGEKFSRSITPQQSYRWNEPQWSGDKASITFTDKNGCRSCIRIDGLISTIENQHRFLVDEKGVGIFFTPCLLSVVK